jgi:hypothetical protein
VPTEDGRHILATYGEFVVGFSKDTTETLPPHWSTWHVLDLEPGYHMPYGRIDTLSEFELTTLQAYIDANQANGFIQGTLLQAAASILITMQQDGRLRHWVDNRALNQVTVKNQYPIPLFSEMVDRVCETKIFTNLDLCIALMSSGSMKATYTRCLFKLLTANSNAGSCHVVQ